MARIRSIKPEFWVSEQVLNLSIPAKLAFIGLWTFCDDYGNHPASHVSLAAQIFPNNNDATPDHLREWMAEILRQGLISEYEAGGHAYWHVTGWARHQHIQKRSPPKYPLPEHYRSTTGTLPEEDESGTGVVWGGEGIGEGEGIGIGEERPPHAPRGARLPLDWEPPKALKTWARTERPDLDTERTLASFRDYWCAKPGRDALKLDWPATYRNWVRKERAPPRNGHAGPDIAHTTVPGPKGPDPALQKIEADRLKAVPMPEAVRVKLAAIRPRSTHEPH